MSTINHVISYRAGMGDSVKRRPSTDSGVPADLGLLSKKGQTQSLVKLREKMQEAIARAKQQAVPESVKKQDAIDIYAELAAREVAIRFDIDDVFKHELIVKVVRKATGEVLWQYPPEQSLHLKRLAKYMPGIFLTQKA